MNITRVSVGGFRNISSNTLYLEKITALLALNSYGKSNLMDAIDFGFVFIKTSNKRKKRMMLSNENMPLTRNLQSTEYSFSLACDLQTENGNYCALYEFSFLWGSENEQGRVVSENLKIKLNQKSQKYKTYIYRDRKTSQYKTSETGRCDKSILIEENALILNKLSAFDDLFYLDAIKELNSIEHFKIEILDAAPSYRPNPIIFKDFDDLDLVGINSIPKVLSILKKEYSAKYDLLISAFKHLFPNFESIVVEEKNINIVHEIGNKINEDSPIQFTNVVYIMSVYDINLIEPIEFESLSDGAKRVFLMLTYAVLADIKGLTLLSIEEPENCIHPKLLQDYVNVLSQLVENCKIILSSHSPYLVQYINPKGLYVGLPNIEGQAVFKPFKSSKIGALMRDAAEDDESIGTYLFQILSQEEDATAILQSYLEA